MHRLTATPGGWTPETDGVIVIEQRKAPIVYLTAADTDVQLLASASRRLPEGFPDMRVASLLQLQQHFTIDAYAADVLSYTKAIVVRLLGGRTYWPYGLEVLKQTTEQTGAALLVLPGDDRPDFELMSHSTAPLAVVDRLWRYFIEGGVENMVRALQFVADVGLGTSYNPLPPQPIPRVGLYHPPLRTPHFPLSTPQVGILFYRAHYLAGNTAPIDALCQALIDRQFQPIPVFVSSLRDAEVQADLLDYWSNKSNHGNKPIQILLNTTSFSLAKLDAETPNLDLWQQLDVPVLQVIFSSSTAEQWQSQTRGLSPRDLAMNVALPEVDGRIISRAVSFKAVQSHDAALETDVVHYQPITNRIEFVADLAANWVRLQQTPVCDRRIALILANYPTRDGRLANGVGLDTPASCVEILKALQQQGYTVTDIPATGDELIQRLTTSITNDPEGYNLRSIPQTLSWDTYQTFFHALPKSIQQGINDRYPSPHSRLPIPGIQLGHIFVGIQPARGYDRDPSLNYHAPDLEPTHEYLAFYHWLRQEFGAQAIVHVGKHGNLEWLPGKGVALSQECYPEAAFGPMPHLYPFIVNDPGEGSQAKRRSQAVILDHLTPPMTRAELYGPLQQLEALVDEYYEAQSLDPTRLPILRDRILQLMQQENLHQEIGSRRQKVIDVDPAAFTPQSLTPDPQLLSSWSEFLAQTDGYLCELKEAQIRDGLHIFGQCPQGRQLRDLIVAIARHPGSGRLGLTRAIAKDWDLAIDPLTAELGEGWEVEGNRESGIGKGEPELAACRTVGDVVERLEQEAARCIETLLTSPSLCPTPAPPTSNTDLELTWIRDRLLPALQQTDQEITNLLRGLNGQYVPSGASGAPTRGRPEVLPTGRNFYSVDIRAIPTESAWDVGRKAAETLIEYYVQEHGEYPRTLALSVWGTSTMRTGGDDLAEAFALLGVQPVWDGAARRVVDFEILPIAHLGRPRVDVTLRISGFFRDAFPNLIDLFHQAVAAVAALDEPIDQNPLAAQVQQETQQWQTQGLSFEQASQRSLYRIFGSKPGAYGAGLQGLIEAQNWTDDTDLARAYIHWSSYAYTGQGEGRSAPDAFEHRLRHLQIVLHNQDNREHDLLDSDDYYQFQGGLTAAVRSLTGQNPQTYFGDHAQPERPKVRQLKAEIARVYRSRVINPKWIAGVMRHGYKGAFEMAATVDYLFAYDATAHCVEDYMYQGVAQAYLFDPQVQAFIQQKNPWALRDMAERLLEAHQRGLWQSIDSATLEQLRSIVHQAEGAIETR
ncbi:cobaltochelatase subunit CobN [Thermocoleostomius sinensis]|uniref:Cobaltochelatase subunit CobN n=1 Tax=Thermocoleostomius sinensis A174 TaxID=2016057 RepID=A0A9E8ZB04_9CYAN|nr:cobaltochelatase subunit CobN [Thermocoleostomius sinensis]WAL59833.1 cobaltochelatase subunit CobN [Thermocoleostomius sinensis A174]